LRLAEIAAKPPDQRTEEEQQLWSVYEIQRTRKNNRSKERSMEKKEEVQKILNKPESQRTEMERHFVEICLGARKRKNEGDCLRRQRMKQLGLKKGDAGMGGGVLGVSARGPLPLHLQQQVQQQHIKVQQQQQHGQHMQVQQQQQHGQQHQQQGSYDVADASGSVVPLSPVAVTTTDEV
jgi:hypothetical protein